MNMTLEEYAALYSVYLEQCIANSIEPIDALTYLRMAKRFLKQ